MRLSELIRIGEKVRVKTVILPEPTAKSLRFLGAIDAPYDAELGGYLLKVRLPGQERNDAMAYKLAYPKRGYTWVLVRQRDDGLFQIDAYG